jgi:hypothetical protein
MNLGGNPVAQPFLTTPTFDLVIFGEGDDELWFEFHDFLALTLRDRVHLMLSKPARFFRNGEPISRVEAMRYQT